MKDSLWFADRVIDEIKRNGFAGVDLYNEISDASDYYAEKGRPITAEALRKYAEALRD